ncbi:putative ABC transporter permease subunit [Fusicatenibacter sp.]
MRNLWILTRFLLKSGPGKSNQKSGKKKAFSGAGRIAVYILLGICLLPVSVLLFMMGYFGYEFLQPLGLEVLMLDFVCAIGMLVIFFYGLPLFLSQYYMDSDLVKLLPLPFTPAEIVGAKGFCCLINEYYLVVLMFFPFLLGYGISAKMGILYWINMILACLIFPVVPLVYAAVLTMIVMRLFKNIRNKDFLSYLGFGASMVFAIGINVFSRSIGNFEMEDIMNLMESQKGTLRAFQTIFPNLTLMTGSLAEASLLKMILYIATTAVILAVFFALAWKIYLPAVLGMSETTSEKRRLTKEEVTRTVKSRNPIRTYAMIEWKKLYRTPAWFMNCVLMPLIWPVFMLGIALISVISSLGMAKATGFLHTLSADGTIYHILRGELPVAIAVLTAAGIAVMVSMFCLISATAMSRKGSEYIYMKCIPMTYHDQIRAMLVSGITISLLGTLPYSLAFNIIAVIFGLHPATLVYTTAITVLFILFINYEQLLFDLSFPKLNWENETAAIKSNNRALISVLIDLTVGAILIGAGWLLYGKLHLNIHITTVVMILITAVLTFAMRTALYTQGASAIRHLEST